MGARFLNTYALYKGDELIDVGTSEYIGRRLGIKPENVRFMSYPAYHRRIKNSRCPQYTVNLGRL